MQRGSRIRALQWLKSIQLYTNRMKHRKHGVPSSEYEPDPAGTGLVVEVGDGVAQTVWEPSLAPGATEMFRLGRRVFHSLSPLVICPVPTQTSEST